MAESVLLSPVPATRRSQHRIRSTGQARGSRAGSPVDRGEIAARGRSRVLLLIIIALALAVRLWGLNDRLPDPTLGINLIADTSVEETDRTTMSQGWAMWRGGTKPLDLNPHTGGWPALSFYLALALQILYRGYHSLVTGGAGGYEFAQHVQSAPDQFFLFARVVSSLIGVLTVLLACRVGASVIGKTGGLVASLLLATNPLHIFSSQHIADPNLLALLFVLLAILPTLRIAETGGFRNSLLAGAMIGLAGACKYVPLALLLPFVLAHFASPSARRGAQRSTRGRRLMAGLLTMAVMMFLASPYLFLDWKTTFHDFQVQRSSVLSGWVGQSPFAISLPQYLVATLPSILGRPAYVLALLGGVFLFRRGTREKLLLSIAVVLIVAVGILKVAQARYALAAVPVLFIATAAGIHAISARLGRFVPIARANGIIAAFFVGASVIWGMPELLATRHAMGLPDSRHLARRWISESIPPRSPMALDLYGPAFNSKGFERAIITWPFYATRASLVEAAYHPEWLDGLGYYVQSGEVSRRYEADAKRYPVEARFYRWFKEHTEVVWRSDPRINSGPIIEVRRLPDSVSTRAARDSLWARVLPTLTIKDQISRWCLVMSELFYAAGNLDRAEEWGQRGLTIPVLSTARQLYSTLALVQARLGEADVAERTARAGLEAFPDDFQLHLSMAMALQQKGRFSEAIAHYRESLRLNPDQERADKIREEIEALETGRR